MSSDELTSISQGKMALHCLGRPTCNVMLVSPPLALVVPSVAYPKKHSSKCACMITLTSPSHHLFIDIHAEELLSHPVEPLGPNVLQAESKCTCPSNALHLYCFV